MKEQIIEFETKINAEVLDALIAEVKHNKMIDIAQTINHRIEQAEKNKLSTDYINALHDIKKLLGITGSLYDLYETL